MHVCHCQPLYPKELASGDCVGVANTATGEDEAASEHPQTLPSFASYVTIGLTARCYLYIYIQYTQACNALFEYVMRRQRLPRHACH